MAALFPGLSPIYLSPHGTTNVPPVGNDPGWSLANVPNVTIPNIPLGATTGNPVPPVETQGSPSYLAQYQQRVYKTK
jgi:hypothetical protein